MKSQVLSMDKKSKLEMKSLNQKILACTIKCAFVSQILYLSLLNMHLTSTNWDSRKILSECMCSVTHKLM